MIAIDHIFVFSQGLGTEGDEIIKLGFNESEGRYHSGQGTTNRKFLFENFFLEVLWVVNEEEVTSDKIKKTSLNRRSSFEKNSLSRFGLCLVNTPATDPLFKDAIAYQPDYFPEGKKIQILPFDENPSLPWLFRLPFRKNNIEPNVDAHHPNHVSTLTSATFYVQENNLNDDIITALNESNQINFKTKNETNLLLAFDHNKQGKSRKIPSLNLQINY